MKEGYITNTEFSKAFYSMIYVSMGLGQATLAMGDTALAAASCIKLYNFFD